jgi:hypothetical protein
MIGGKGVGDRCTPDHIKCCTYPPPSPHPPNSPLAAPPAFRQTDQTPRQKWRILVFHKVHDHGESSSETHRWISAGVASSKSFPTDLHFLLFPLQSLRGYQGKVLAAAPT